MFNKGEIRQNLLGCLEIVLFMRQGASRFGATASSMKKSFVIPVLVALPLTFVIVLTAHPRGVMTGGDAQLLMLIYGLRLMLSLGLFFTLMYFMARKNGALENFYRFATAYNWLFLPTTLLMLPLVIAFLNGHYAWGEIYPLMVFITMYSYVCTAFMITFVMRVPWELAGCIAITSMAIHMGSLDVMKWLAVSAISLVS